jgi:hypothetical protein
MAKTKNLTEDVLELQTEPTKQTVEKANPTSELNLFESFKSKFSFKEDTYFVHQVVDGKSKVIALKGSFDDLKNYEKCFDPKSLVFFSELISYKEAEKNKNYFAEPTNNRKFILSTSILVDNIFANLRASTRVVGYDNKILFSFASSLETFAFFYEVSNTDYSEHFVKKIGLSNLQSNHLSGEDIERKRLIVTGNIEFHLFNILNFPTELEMDTKEIYNKIIGKLNLVK